MIFLLITEAQYYCDCEPVFTVPCSLAGPTQFSGATLLSGSFLLSDAQLSWGNTTLNKLFFLKTLIVSDIVDFQGFFFFKSSKNTTSIGIQGSPLPDLACLLMLPFRSPILQSDWYETIFLCLTLHHCACWYFWAFHFQRNRILSLMPPRKPTFTIPLCLKFCSVIHSFNICLLSTYHVPDLGENRQISELRKLTYC